MTPQQTHHIILMSIWWRYYIDMLKRIHRQISTSFRLFFFNIISMSEKSTSFRCTFFDVISMCKLLTSFRCTLFNIISMTEKLTSFRCTFSTQLWWLKNRHCFDVLFKTYFNRKKKGTLFRFIFFKQFWWKNYANSSCWLWFIFER